MSQENVKALRELYEEWGKGNFRAGADLFSPGVVMETFVERTSVHGLEGVNDYMRAFLEQWRSFRIEAHEFAEAGDSVVVTERQHAIGESSGIETVKTFYSVWTFEDERVVRVRWDDDRATAFKAAGAPE